MSAVDDYVACRIVVLKIHVMRRHVVAGDIVDVVTGWGFAVFIRLDGIRTRYSEVEEEELI